MVVGSLSVGLLVPAGPAQAAEANTYQPTATLEPQLQGYVDRATPDETYPNPSGDLPVGARVDPSGKHVTRSYFTFDVAGLRGKQIVTATLAAKETHANDCAHRAVEVWVTDPYTEDSRWDYQPAQKFRVASAGVPESGCAVTDARFDVAKALTWAAKNDQETLTLALRVAGNKETDERYGRRYEAAPSLAVHYNTPPPRPTGMVLAGRPCATSAPGIWLPATSTDIYATLPDDADGPEEDKLGRLAVWPVDDESQRQERVSRTYSHWPNVSFNTYYLDLRFEHGRTYAWQLQADDGDAQSPWSRTCYFTVDTASPSTPTVTSPEYPNADQPTGDVGVAGKFTFTANDDDVVAFRWGRYWPDTDVKADRPGGTATITLRPEEAGQQYLTVQSVDRAGNTSDVSYHSYWVRESRPTVESWLYTPWGPAGGIGVLGEFRFTSNQDGATRFIYQVNEGPNQTAQVAPEGPTTVSITPSVGGLNTLRVRTRDASGTLSAWRAYTFTVDTAPQVQFDGNLMMGQVSTVSLSPGMPEVTEYEYWFNDDESEKTTVPASADGTASFTWVPSMAMWPLELKVRSRSTGGILSAIAEPYVRPDEVNPEVTGPEQGKPGQPMTFTFSSRMPGVTEYVWSLAPSEEKHVLPAGPDGVGRLTFTPTEDGSYYLGVQARNATGALSGGSGTSFYVTSAPQVKSTVYPAWRTSGGVGVEGNFDVEPQMPNVIEYIYQFRVSFADGPETTVAAGADGKLSLSYTPSQSGYHTLKIRSRSVDGTLSGWNEYTFIVDRNN
ncbi:hypothetical protein [Micromonospora sp. NBC_01638]|uniref:hypothetical protein n=1 Tax=Micromonospora sp. NBC_01638 TaxID=2975982 RepID=UPI003865C3BD|nr:hypothetical protein OG811_11880 [Micromonospora sp. NBC_01638]